jgi:formylglycine-generating enzyme required for sulfatase activity
MSPKPADTVRPPATFTPKPTDTPRPTAVQTLGIGSSKISPIDGATMLFVPAGELTMGSNVSGNEELPHPVYLDAFWIDRFEVTNALDKKCVDAAKCSAPLEGKSYTRSSYYGNAQFDNYPVGYVS